MKVNSQLASRFAGEDGRDVVDSMTLRRFQTIEARGAGRLIEREASLRYTLAG
jgi:hypothetical protein